MNLADLTVIVPAHDHSRNLPTFVRSLPQEVQLLVVGNPEGDPVFAARPWTQSTRLLRHWGNVAQARQFGAEAAQTPWLLFSGAGVVFDTEYFSHLQTCQEFDALYGPKLALARPFRERYRRLAAGQQVLHALGIPAISNSNFLVNRQKFFEAGGLATRFGSIAFSELGWQLMRRGCRLELMPQLIVYDCNQGRLDEGAAAKPLHPLLQRALLRFNRLPIRRRRDNSPVPSSNQESPQWKSAGD